MTEHIPVEKFKDKCSELIDKVYRSKKRIIITKRNKPIAQLTPIKEEQSSLFGKMKGTVQIVGDLLAPMD